MRKSLTILSFLATSCVAGAALADDDCHVPMSEWQPREAVQRMAEERGWTVRRIKIDDGCYEIDLRDADGRALEVTVDPGTLGIIEMEYEDEGAADLRDAPSRAEPGAVPGTAPEIKEN
ncbi:PepSY domain-containing protein [Actibacterium sp. MT2.3-13A]|uniref:PepSY domain-containing protein n=1 Tax=Actibacterium sp. MT2.3-13A TaxID=2828332 RepID=UPI001BA8D31B|nr:PepSY domain-containing protein [Actibacterium sp. MT2.3-13A]